ncbi:TolC family protein [Desulfonema ishimotonii]|uniref:TolC family protein n=1 Tax=Desulfonema ishimotonii TaxID=45657 RepID=A0A401FTP7_9BACT|nr:TolC family protein [Desulfonema ishimotonii]GBC60333.1 TolC family protein [Desulfonema ishimotonii]
MKLIFLIFSIFFVLSASPAFGGYQEMKAEIDTYEPPAYLLPQTRAPLAEPTEKPARETGSENEKQQMWEMKARWERALSANNDEPAFVRPAPRLLKHLKPATDNASVAIRSLGDGFSLEILEALTLLRNPGIRAAKRRVRAELESFTQVSDLDEVLRQYTAFTEGLMNGVGPMKGKDSVKMKFPFPGVTALKGQVVEQSVRAAREGLEIARREAVTGARKAYWNLLFIRKARQITSETVNLFRDLEAVADTRYRSGATSFQDVIKVSIRTKILEEDLITLREKQRNIEAGLRAILNLSPDAAIGHPANRKPGVSLPSLSKLWPLAREKRQELRKMRAMIGKMERMTEMAETMILPPFTLGFSVYEDEAVIQTGSAAMKPSFPVKTMASAGAGLPKKPWFGTRDAWLGQTRQSLAALREDLKKAEAATDNMVRNAWFALDKAIREAALYRNTVVGLSRSALDVSTRGYESGSVSFADVISSYADWLNVSLALARKQSDIGVSKAELAQVAGISF